MGAWLNPLRSYLPLLRIAAVLAVVAGLAFAGWKVRDAFAERDELRLQVASLQASLENERAIAKHTTIVLSQRAQSRAAIADRAKDVQVQIEKRIPDGIVALPPAWRLLHDAAAADEPVPPASAGADAAAVTPKEAASTVASNYATCHDTADRLRALQEWIRGVSQGGRP